MLVAATKADRRAWRGPELRTPTDIRHGTLDVDELWLREWAAQGIAALERSLAKHAAFEEYLRTRADLQSANGDVARTPDAELLRRLRARDRQAWEELYAEYQPRLRAFAYRLAGNVHDADDLVQETFVRAVPRLDRLDPDTAEIAPYLFTALRNLFLKQVERGKRQQPVAEVPEPVLPAPIEDDPQRSLLLAGQQEEVRIANWTLQPRQRLVLALRELEDLARTPRSASSSG